MIRWSYVLPRLLVLVAVLAFVAFAVDPLIHFGLTRVGQSLIGAKVELAGVNSSISGARLRIDGIRVADPSSPMKNLFEAEAAYLDLNAESLLLRRLVIDRGHISGIQLDTARQTSGALAGGEASESSTGEFPLDEEFLAAMGEHALEELKKDSETIQRIETAEERWDGRTDGLKQRVEQLKQNADAFQEHYRNFNARDPRQVAQALAEGPRQIDSMRRELDVLRREIDGLQNAVVNELTGLSEARDRDIQKWRERLKVREFKAMEFTSYLLSPTLEKRLDEAMQWVEAGQKLAAKTAAPEGRAISDEEIRFSNYQDPPNCLIRELILDGHLLMNGQPVEFAAIASDVAFPPERHSRPIRIRLKTRGDVNAQVTAILDHRTGEPIQKMTVDCPDLALPARQLGKDGKFALHSAAGRGKLRCTATLRNGRIEGAIHFLQSKPALSVEVSPKLGSRIRESLSTSLAQVPALQATIRFEGDPRNPSYSIDSDLGNHVAAAVNTAAAAELAHQEGRVKERLDREIQSRLQELNAKAEAKKQQLLAELNVDAQQIQQLMKLLPQNSIGRMNLPLQLPINGIYRR